MKFFASKFEKQIVLAFELASEARLTWLTKCTMFEGSPGNHIFSSGTQKSIHQASIFVSWTFRHRWWRSSNTKQILIFDTQCWIRESIRHCIKYRHPVVFSNPFAEIVSHEGCHRHQLSFVVSVSTTRRGPEGASKSGTSETSKTAARRPPSRPSSTFPGSCPTARCQKRNACRKFAPGKASTLSPTIPRVSLTCQSTNSTADQQQRIEDCTSDPNLKEVHFFAT